MVGPEAWSESVEEWVPANGMDLAYTLHGRSGPLVLLVAGLGQQLVVWPHALIARLLRAGFRVLRYDHRDVGYSTKIDVKPAISSTQALIRFKLGLPVPAPYKLEDLAADAIGLVDGLGFERFHLVGISMGGMIGQLVASWLPDRCLSLSSIMSTSGENNLPLARLEFVASMLRRRPWRTSRSAIMEYELQWKRMVSGFAYPTSDEACREAVLRSLDRMHYPPGYARHALAVLASPDRRDLLRELRVPTQVIHGGDDPLIQWAHGRRVAALVPNAQFHTIAGWGHDLAPGVVPHLSRLIIDHLSASEGVVQNATEDAGLTAVSSA